jgi:hypothetical protein
MPRVRDDSLIPWQGFIALARRGGFHGFLHIPHYAGPHRAGRVGHASGYEK